MKIKFPAFQIAIVALSSLLTGLVRADDHASPALPADLAGFRLGASEQAQQEQQQSATTQAVPPGKSLPWYDDLINHRVPIEFGLKVTEVYSDNIFYQPKKTGDFITEIAPFVAFHLGHPFVMQPKLNQETADSKADSADLNYFSIFYQPTFTIYADNSNLDTVDQHADAIYSHRFSKLTLSLEQLYQKLSQPEIQVNSAGALVLRDIYTTTAQASYAYSDKLSLYGTAMQKWTDYQSNLYSSNTEWTLDSYFLYQLFPKMSVGVGPRIGFVDIDRAPNQTYQSVLFHAFFPATGKLSFVGAAGGEVREFQHNVVADKVTPVLEAQAIYQPFDSMSISLNASRHSIVSSSQIGDNYTASTVSLQMRQRLLQVVYFHVGAGFEDDSYSAAGGSGSSTTRDDSIYFVNTGVEWTSKDWLVLDGSYTYTRDDSNLELFKFDESRFTASATLKY